MNRVQLDGKFKDVEYFHHQWYQAAESFLILAVLFPVFSSVQSLSCIWLFATDGQSIGALASASVAPMNIQVDFLQGGLV